MTTATLAAKIETLQGVQKANPPTSTEWQRASEQLRPLFAEMARRQRANNGAPDWREWSDGR